MPKANWGKADKAIDDLRDDPNLTMRAAAAKYGVGLHQIRARIYYKFGSLKELRGGAKFEAKVRGRPKKADQPTRRCMRCKKGAKMDRNHRMCDDCRAKVTAMNDGYC